MCMCKCSESDRMGFFFNELKCFDICAPVDPQGAFLAELILMIKIQIKGRETQQNPFFMPFVKCVNQIITKLQSTVLMKDFPLSACASGRTCSAPVGADMDDLFFRLQSYRNGSEWAWMVERV